jgi:hypothetical protein
VTPSESRIESLSQPVRFQCRLLFHFCAECTQELCQIVNGLALWNRIFIASSNEATMFIPCICDLRHRMAGFLKDGIILDFVYWKSSRGNPPCGVEAGREEYCGVSDCPVFHGCNAYCICLIAFLWARIAGALADVRTPPFALKSGLLFISCLLHFFLPTPKTACLNSSLSSLRSTAGRIRTSHTIRGGVFFSRAHDNFFSGGIDIITVWSRAA